MKKQLFNLSAGLSLLLVCFFTTANAQSKKGNSKPTTTVSRSVSAGDNSTEVVTITITKEAFRGHAQIEEDFSADLQATEISGSHATFRASSGKATFDWDNIPEDKTVTVSYSLRAIKKTAEDQSVSGHLAYQNQTFNMPASSFTIKYTGNAPATTVNHQDFDASSTNTLQDLYYVIFGEYPGNSEGTEPYSSVTPAKANMAATKAPKVAPKHEEPAQKPAMAEAPKPAPIAPSTPAPAPVAPAAAPAPATNPAVSTAVAPTSAPAAVPAAATSDVVYRVQIAAVPDKSKADGILKQYKITDQPYFEVVSASVTRVMVGNYSNLNDAKARIAELKTNGLTGAYVAPYYKGKRVSLTEAAAHSKQ